MHSLVSSVFLLVAADAGSHADPQDDLPAIHAAAAQGDTRAQLKLGFRYRFGIGLPMDYAQAAQWYLKAAQQGHPGAQTIVGLLCVLGDGLPKNAENGKTWLCRAADQGDTEAQIQLELLEEGVMMI
ncbi:MAG: sel1 repeat family protein [Magnetococcus sp. XQGC-1]